MMNTMFGRCGLAAVAEIAESTSNRLRSFILLSSPPAVPVSTGAGACDSAMARLSRDRIHRGCVMQRHRFRVAIARVARVMPSGLRHVPDPWPDFATHAG